MTDADTMDRVRGKIDEYLMLLSPLQRAENDILMAHRMLKLRTEDEINDIAPMLGALSEALNVSSVDLLLAEDREAFVQAAMVATGLTADEVRGRLAGASSTAREELRLLGFDETI